MEINMEMNKSGWNKIQNMFLLFMCTIVYLNKLL